MKIILTGINKEGCWTPQQQKISCHALASLILKAKRKALSEKQERGLRNQDSYFLRPALHSLIVHFAVTLAAASLALPCILQLPLPLISRSPSTATARIPINLRVFISPLQRLNAISIKDFFLAAYQACFLIFASVFRCSVSAPFPYLSYRPCLPLQLSFPCCPYIFSQRGFQLQPQQIYHYE